jgi:hypothetical protein
MHNHGGKGGEATTEAGKNCRGGEGFGESEGSAGEARAQNIDRQGSEARATGGCTPGLNAKAHERAERTQRDAEQ